MIAACFLTACAEHGARPALEGPDGQQLSYDELLLQARRVAEGLQGERLVVLQRGLDIEWVITAWGAWLAGAAIAPLDPTWPHARRQSCVEELQNQTLPEGLAWVIHSSGSTGYPKSVQVLERGVPALLDAQIAAFRLTPESRVLAVLSPAFDACLSDLLTTQTAGGCLVLPDRSQGGPLLSPATLVEVLGRREISHVDLPPALVARTPAEELPSCLETVVMGGEPCPVPAARAWARRVRLVNVYGPTEATICTSLGVVDPDTWSRPLLGRPIVGVEYRLVDGELWIAGACLASGYGDKKLSQERFVHRDGCRWFRTGDRVEQEGDDWVYLGRLDRMVKLQGRALHPEEVERVLAGRPGVERAAAWIANDRVEAAVQPRGLDGGALLEELRNELPLWMLPRAIHALDTIPQTSSGKIALAPLKRRVQSTSLLTGLWSRALNVEVGWHDNLTGLGRDSLAVLEVCAEAATLGLELPPERAMNAESCAQMAGQFPRGRPCEELRGSLPRLPVWPGGTIDRPRRVLVTGASGTLGRPLVAALQIAGLEVVSLVRHRERGLPGREIIGDVEQAELGLPTSEWLELCQSVDTVVHLAADLHALAPSETLWPCNVQGTLEVLRLVCSGRPKHFHHVSTLAVFACSDQLPGVLAADAPLPDAGLIYGGYPQTKWAAEALATAHAKRGPVCVHRLGHLVNGSTGNEHLSRLIRGLAGSDHPGGPQRCNLTSLTSVVETLARSVVEGQTGVTHLASQSSFSLADLMAAVLGRPCANVSSMDRALARRVLLAPDTREPWNPFLSTGWTWAQPGLGYEGPSIEELVARVASEDEE